MVLRVERGMPNCGILRTVEICSLMGGLRQTKVGFRLDGIAPGMTQRVVGSDRSPPKHSLAASWSSSVTGEELSWLGVYCLASGWRRV